MELFWHCGYDGASIHDLTQAMGIKPPSLYAAFGSKEELFREAVDLYNTGSPTWRALEEGATARESIERMLRENVADYVDPETPVGCFIVLGAPIGGPGSRSVQDYLAALRRETADTIAKRVERGIDEGDVPAGTDTIAAGEYYNTVLNGISISARDGSSRDALDAVVDAAMAAWESLTQRHSRG
jgi:AcrR family transcriptional regulator